MNVAKKRFSLVAGLLCTAALALAAWSPSPARADDGGCAKGREGGCDCCLRCEIWTPADQPDRGHGCVPTLWVRAGDPVLFKVKAFWEPCGSCAREGCCHYKKVWLGNVAIPPFLNSVGARIGRGYVCLEVRQIVKRFGQPGCYWDKFEARDKYGCIREDCKIRICLLPPLCDEDASCAIETPDGTAATHDGPPINIIVCATAGCEDVHGVAVGVDLPGFLGLLGQFTNSDGDCCYHYQVFPCDTDTGDFQLCWDAFNSDAEKPTGGCCVDITID